VIDKLIATGADRAAALLLTQTLEKVTVARVKTNAAFLHGRMTHPAFRKGTSIRVSSPGTRRAGAQGHDPQAVTSAPLLSSAPPDEPRRDGCGFR